MHPVVDRSVFARRARADVGLDATVGRRERVGGQGPVPRRWDCYVGVVRGSDGFQERAWVLQWVSRGRSGVVSGRSWR